MITDGELGLLPFADKLTSDEKTAVLSRTNHRFFQKGCDMHGFCDACMGYFYALKGSIRVYITSREGREITLFYIKAGNSCVLSASCVLGKLALEPSFTAEEDTEILLLESASYAELMQSNIYVKCFSYELSTKRFSMVMKVFQDILFAPFEERLAAFLLEAGGNGAIHMTQESMAREVNTAREVVARTLKQFADEGIIEMGRGTVKLLKPEKLKALLN